MNEPTSLSIFHYPSPIKGDRSAITISANRLSTSPSTSPSTSTSTTSSTTTNTTSSSTPSTTLALPASTTTVREGFNLSGSYVGGYMNPLSPRRALFGKVGDSSKSSIGVYRSNSPSTSMISPRRNGTVVKEFPVRVVIFSGQQFIYKCKSTQSASDLLLQIVTRTKAAVRGLEPSKLELRGGGSALSASEALVHNRHISEALNSYSIPVLNLLPLEKLSVNAHRKLPLPKLPKGVRGGGSRIGSALGLSGSRISENLNENNSDQGPAPDVDLQPELPKVDLLAERKARKEKLVIVGILPSGDEIQVSSAESTTLGRLKADIRLRALKEKALDIPVDRYFFSLLINNGTSTTTTTTETSSSPNSNVSLTYPKNSSPRDFQESRLLEDESSTLKELLDELGRGNILNQELTLKFVPKSRLLLTKEELEREVVVHRLIGLPQLSNPLDDETTSLRLRMATLRSAVRSAILSSNNSLVETSTSSTTEENHELSPTPSRHLMLSVVLPLCKAKKTLKIHPQEITPKGLIEQLVTKHYQKFGEKPSSFVLKVVGEEDYLDGEKKLSSFAVIRRAQRTTSGDLYRLELVLSRRPNDLEDVSSIEDTTHQKHLTQQYQQLICDINYTHSDLSASYPSKPWDKMTAISLWDLDRPFRVRVLGIESLGPYYRKLNVLKSSLSSSSTFSSSSSRVFGGKQSLIEDNGRNSGGLYVTVGIYHGGELLAPIVATGLVSNSPNPRWGHWLSPPGLILQDLPRAARLCITLWARISRIESSTDDLSSDMPNKSPETRSRSGTVISAGNEKELSSSNVNMNMPLNGSASGISTSILTTTNSGSLSNNSNNTDDWNAVEETLERDVPVGWVNCQIFDHKNNLRTGQIELALWPNSAANPIGTSLPNPISNAAVLYLEFDVFQLPVVFPTSPSDSSNTSSTSLRCSSNSIPISRTNLSPMNLDKIDAILRRDPLSPLQESEKQLLWSSRHYLSQHRPHSLPRVLMSANYAKQSTNQELPNLLRTWGGPLMVDVALELLDSRFAAACVREIAVEFLEAASNEDLADYLLQLIQVLKYEPYHDSPLARFLVRRALLSRTIGQAFFWYLKSELYLPEIAERYGLLLEAYLLGCSRNRLEALLKQDELIMKLLGTANLIKTLKDTDRSQAMLESLRKIEFATGPVLLPLGSGIEVDHLDLSRCKYMDSKKLPLYLSFRNAETGAVVDILFKSGDDLRQDMLTLQMLRLMDKLWRQEGLELSLSPYGCLATGDGVGLIEVVQNAETTAAIAKQAGGATAVFLEAPLANWLQKHNPDEKSYQLAVGRFVSSCAGYCVATYLLGIGDRHNDNIMVTRDGRLFHIDFGHFLGNYKKKFGFKRERAPFVLTKDFAFVMGGEGSPNFLRFVDLCCKAYNSLRQHANSFFNLFAMMLSTGIPELTGVEDLEYLRKSFSVELTGEEANALFKKRIYESLSDKYTVLNNAIHILAH